MAVPCDRSPQVSQGIPVRRHAANTRLTARDEPASRRCAPPREDPAPLGIDHTKLTYNYSGRDFRLTDVAGEVIHDIIA